MIINDTLQLSVRFGKFNPHCFAKCFFVNSVTPLAISSSDLNETCDEAWKTKYLNEVTNPLQGGIRSTTLSCTRHFLESFDNIFRGFVHEVNRTNEFLRTIAIRYYRFSWSY